RHTRFSRDWSSDVCFPISPTALVGAETVRPPAGDGAGVTPNEPLLPRHFRTGELEPGGDLVGGRWLLLANDDVRLLAAAATEPRSEERRVGKARRARWWR